MMKNVCHQEGGNFVSCTHLDQQIGLSFSGLLILLMAENIMMFTSSEFK
jgi:hypothetical protein